jgi:hypothetical protein
VPVPVPVPVLGRGQRAEAIQRITTTAAKAGRYMYYIDIFKDMSVMCSIVAQPAIWCATMHGTFLCTGLSIIGI